MHATHISKDAYIINDLKILVWKLWKDINFIVSLPTVKTENQIKLECPRERNTMQFAAQNGLTQPSHNKWDCNCIWDCRALFEKVAYSMTSLPHCTKIPCSTHSEQTFSKEAQNFVQLLVWTTVQFYAQDAKPKFQFQPKPNVKYNSISTEYLEISAVEGKLHFKPRGPRHQLIFCLGNVRY